MVNDLMGEGNQVDSLNKIDEVISSKNRDIQAQFRFILTQLCNEYCFFCHNEWLPVSKAFMSESFFNKVIHIIKNNNYKQKIRFTGWEPFLHPKLFDFIRTVRRELPHVNLGITTNWLLIKKKLFQILSSNIDSLNVSIHSMDADSYKKITWVNWLPVVLEGLKNLKSNNFSGKININTVIGNSNIEDIKKLYDFAQGANFWLKFMDMLMYNNHDSMQVLENLISIEQLRERISGALGDVIKEDRTQPKCLKCEHKDVCWHEASYLRITPWEILKPCLSLKEYDIDLKWLSDEDMNKAFSLWLYRVKNLNM